MTRKKVQLAYITNDSARKATYKKRKNGLLKKVHEISTLCGVDACVIIYSPYDAQPVLWPPSDVAVQRVLAQFRRMPEMDQSKKMVNQETFLRERIVKIKDQLKKLIKDNREKEMVEVMFQSLLGKDMSNMSLLDFNDLAWLIDSFSREITMIFDKCLKDGSNEAQGNVSGPDLVVDTKPPISSVNPSMVHPPIPPSGPYDAMQNQAHWFPGGFVNSYHASSSNNQPYLLPVVNNNMMPPPPPQFNVGELLFNSGAGPSSSNNLTIGFSRVRNDMMVPPLSSQFNMGGFVNKSGAGASSFNNQPARLPEVNEDMMPPPPPPPFNIDDV